ncbi:MAG: hypothetical protein H5U22_06335 [Rhizobium sp.]|nr:hypothetical protein [Rhizobium sp.]
MHLKRSLKLSTSMLGLSQRDVPITKIVVVDMSQSNGSGRGTNNQTYTSSVVPAAKLFANDNTLKAMADPTDSNSGQIDSVSDDAAAAGSIWPVTFSRMLDYWSSVGEKVPEVVFVPCAKGGTSITSWLPGADHLDRSTLYGSALYRARLAGSGRPGVLTVVQRIQGETDAAAGMSQATYEGHLATLAAAVRADFKCDLVVSKFPYCTSTNANTGQAAIWAAIDAAWGDANIVQGADLSTVRVDSGDGLHMAGDILLSVAADKMALALQSACGKPSGVVVGTNLVPTPDAVSGWAGNARVTTTADVGTSPLTGLTTLDRVTTDTDGASTSKLVLTPSFSVVSGVGYAISTVVKAETLQFLQFTGNTAVWGATSYINFDMVNGLVGNKSGFVGHVEPLGNGFFRIEAFLASLATSAAAQIAFRTIPTLTSARAPFTSPDGATFLIGNVKCEARQSASPYV